MSPAHDEDTLAISRRLWTFNHEQDLPALLDRAAEVIASPAGQAHVWFEGAAAGTAAITGSARGADLAPLVPALASDLAHLEGEAAAGQVSWAWMELVDQVAVLAAMGAPGAEALMRRVPACLPSITTGRNIDIVHYHWDRGLAALFLDLPAMYRPISGHDVKDPLRFTPRVRVGFNMQALLAHLAGAVEQRAALADCEAAWHETLANFRILDRAQMLATPSLVWIAAILHHRVAGRPLATSADYLRDSVNAILGA